MCDVDRAWFPPDHLGYILVQFPENDPLNKTIRIPEDIKFETPTEYHHYIFKGGVPYHGVISKEIIKTACRYLILHKRKVT